jgi:hypothetical protein
VLYCWLWLQELMLSVAALAQLSFYDPHLVIAASTAFVEAVAAIQDDANTNRSSSSSSSTANADSCSDVIFASKRNSPTSSTTTSHSKCIGSSSRLQTKQQGQHQQQGVELLHRIRDHQLVINYLWANASLGHADSLLLQAALQLLLQRGLVPNNISKSHLPLCLWALAALLVCLLQDQQHHQQQQGCPQHTQQFQMGDEMQQLVCAVAAEHSMLAQQALQLWQGHYTGSSSRSSSPAQDDRSRGSASLEAPQPAAPKVKPASSSRHKAKAGGHSSSTGVGRPAFSIDSRRQMCQAHIWLQAAVSAAGGGSSAVAAAAAGGSSPAHSSGSGCGSSAVAAADTGGGSSSPGALPQPSTTSSTSTLAGSGGLWSLPRLLQEAEQLYASQQQEQEQQDLLVFWQWCGAAWAGNKAQVSGLQRGVFQVRCDLEWQTLHQE